MRHGFIKTAAGTPKIQVADCVYNAGEILKLIRQMETEGAKIMAFPELCITGYTCQDLFWQTLLLDSAKEQLVWLAGETSAGGCADLRRTSTGNITESCTMWQQS